MVSFGLLCVQGRGASACVRSPRRAPTGGFFGAILVVVIITSSVSSNDSVALLVDSAALLFEYRKKTKLWSPNVGVADLDATTTTHTHTKNNWNTKRFSVHESKKGGERDRNSRPRKISKFTKSLYYHAHTKNNWFLV